MTKEEQGRKCWKSLHTYAQNGVWDPKGARRWLFREWLPTVPQTASCRCQDNFELILKSLPPVFDTEVDFKRWTWRVHNRVNSKLGKKTFTREQYKEAYGVDV